MKATVHNNNNKKKNRVIGFFFCFGCWVGTICFHADWTGICLGFSSSTLTKSWHRLTHTCGHFGVSGFAHCSWHGGQGPKWQRWALLSLWWHSGLIRHLMLHFGGSTIFSMPHGSFFFWGWKKNKNMKGLNQKKQKLLVKKKRALRRVIGSPSLNTKSCFFPRRLFTSPRMAVPQAHDTTDVRVHCRHGPVWHKVWHTWFWQVSLRPQLFFFIIMDSQVFNFFFFWKWKKEKNGREREALACTCMCPCVCMYVCGD